MPERPQGEGTALARRCKGKGSVFARTTAATRGHKARPLPASAEPNTLAKKPLEALASFRAARSFCISASSSASIESRYLRPPRTGWVSMLRLETAAERRAATRLKGSQHQLLGVQP